MNKITLLLIGVLTVALTLTIVLADMAEDQTESQEIQIVEPMLEKDGKANAYCFVYPIGTKNRYTEARDGDGWYNAQDFGVRNPDFGNKFHLGEDWNLETGGNSDCGKPVKAAGNGIVVYSGNGGAGWGNVIIIKHSLFSGLEIETQYAHLLQRYVQNGTTVTTGQTIGTIGDGSTDGKCDGVPWTAHLHFELRIRPTGTPGPGYSYNKAGWTDPSKFIDSMLCPVIWRWITEDGQSPGFEKYGPEQEWNYATGVGLGNDMLWAWNNVGNENGVFWKPKLQGGNYKVYAFIPSNHATTKKAHYVIKHAGGTTTKVVDQSIYFDEWVYLGSYSFNSQDVNGNQYVKLTDRTGESSKTRKVGFDAMMWFKS